MYRAKTNNGTLAKRFESDSLSHFIAHTHTYTTWWICLAEWSGCFCFCRYTVIQRYRCRLRRRRLLLRRKFAGFMCNFSSFPQMATLLLLLLLSSCLELWDFHVVWIRAHTKIYVSLCADSHRALVYPSMCVVARLHENVLSDSPICLGIGFVFVKNSSAVYIVPTSLCATKNFP